MVKMKIFGIISILFLMCNNIGCDDVQESPSFCADLKPQNSLVVDQVGGVAIKKICSQNKIN